MATNFSISANLDSSGFKRGTDAMSDGLDSAAKAMAELESQDLNGAEDSLESVGDAAKDAAREVETQFENIEDSADAAGEKIEDSFNSATKDAGNEVDDLEKKFRTALDNIGDQAKASGDKVGKSFKDGTDRAEDGMDELKDEADGTAREAAASFDGSAESIGDVFQELAANAFAGFGPAGAAAGLAVAVGIGVAISKLQEMADAVNEAKEAGAEWAQSFNAEDVSGRLAAVRDRLDEMTGEIQDSKEWWELWQDDAVTALEAVEAGLRESGIAASEFNDAMTETDPEERADKLNSLAESLRDSADAYNENNKAAANRFDIPEARMWGEKRDAVNEAADALEKEARTQEAANEADRIRAESMGLTIEQYRTYNDLSDEAKDRVDQLAKGDRGAAVEAEEHAEARAELNEQIEDGIDASRDLIKATWDLEDAEKELNEALGIGAKRGRASKEALFDYAGAAIDAADASEEASGKTSSYNKVIENATDKFYKAARAAGYNDDEIRKMVRQYGLVPKKVNTDVTVSGKNKAIREMDDVLQKAGIKKDLTVGVRAATGQADTDVANWRARQQQIVVNMHLRAI